jgi:hypothetical protein
MSALVTSRTGSPIGRTLSGMSAPPVDWGALTLRLRAGDRVCTRHGLVAVAIAPIGIPVCALCRQMVSIVSVHPGGTLRGFTEPAPAHCAAAERHPLTAGAVTVSWLPCACPAAAVNNGGHRAWRCSVCVELGRDDSVLGWPECSLAGGESPVGEENVPPRREGVGVSAAPGPDPTNRL